VVLATLFYDVIKELDMSKLKEVINKLLAPSPVPTLNKAHVPEWVKHVDNLKVAEHGAADWPIANEFMNDFLSSTFILTESADPWDPNLTDEQKKAIIDRCRVDAVYYFKKVVSANPPSTPKLPNPKTTDVPQFVKNLVYADAQYEILKDPSNRQYKNLTMQSCTYNENGKLYTFTEIFRPR
jgi:hypothetical protein